MFTLCDWCWMRRASVYVPVFGGFDLHVCQGCAARVGKYRLTPDAVAGVKAGAARRALEVPSSRVPPSL